MFTHRSLSVVWYGLASVLAGDEVQPPYPALSPEDDALVTAALADGPEEEVLAHCHDPREGFQGTCLYMDIVCGSVSSTSPKGRVESALAAVYDFF